MSVGIEMARTYSYKVIWMLEQGMKVNEEASIAKHFASSVAMKSAFIEDLRQRRREDPALMSPLKGVYHPPGLVQLFLEEQGGPGAFFVKILVDNIVVRKYDPTILRKAIILAEKGGLSQAAVRTSQLAETHKRQAD